MWLSLQIQLIQNQKTQRNCKSSSLSCTLLPTSSFPHSKSSSHPTPDSLYADPNVIEHQTTTTRDEYAMVDVKGKKKQPTQEAALYQVLRCYYWHFI